MLLYQPNVVYFVSSGLFLVGTIGVNRSWLKIICLSLCITLLFSGLAPVQNVLATTLINLAGMCGSAGLFILWANDSITNAIMKLSNLVITFFFAAMLFGIQYI